MPKILFVCTANRFRSPLAEVFFIEHLRQENLSDDWEVDSAGTWVQASLPPTSEANREAEKRGFSIREKRSKNIENMLIKDYDLVIVMEKSHKEALLTEFPALKEKIFLLTEISGRIGYSIPDPYESKESPSLIAEEIYCCIQNNLDTILRLAQNQR